LAFDIWYKMFGQGQKLPFGTMTLLNRDKVQKNENPYNFFDNAPSSRYTPYTGQDIGQFPGKGLNKIAVEIVKNGDPITIKKSAVTDTGRGRVLQIVLDAYDTDPNFRNRLGK